MCNNNILVVSPHPDDMEIGMGGTAAKMIDQGINVVSLVVTDGRRSTSVGILGEEEMAEIREKEVKEASMILGIQNLILLRLPGMKTSENQTELRKSIAQIMNRFKPTQIYLPHPEIDKHPTHRTVSEITIDSLSNKKLEQISYPKEIWCYEIWTPFEQYTRIEDISDYIEKKSASVKAHRSQIAYKDYTEGIKGLNRYRAVFNETSGVTDMEFAEIFVEFSL